MIRISTASAFDTGISTLQKRQGDLNEAQQQLTSGKRISRLSDDPVAAARAERARAAQARADADQRAVDASRSAVAQIESAFSDAGDLVQQARELLVAAGNTSYGPNERRGMAQQLAAIRTQLLQVANRGDGAGGFLFSGQGVGSPPFVDAPGGVTYGATPGTTQTASSEPLPLAADGRAAFLEARSGNGVFVTAAGSAAGTAWIDAGGVTNPSQLTGLPYSVQFTAGGAGSTFTVLRNGAATALTNVPYVSGQAIQIDGMAFTVTGVPANGDNFTISPSAPDLSLFDTLDSAAAALNNAEPGRRRAEPDGGRRPARHRRCSDATRQCACRCGRLAAAARQRAIARRRTETAGSNRAIECRRPGHGARHFRLPAQANGLRCRAAGLFDDAALVPVRLPRFVMPGPR